MPPVRSISRSLNSLGVESAWCAAFEQVRVVGSCRSAGNLEPSSLQVPTHRDLWQEDHLQEWVEKAYELLEEVELPRYHRTKTLILIVSSLDDIVDARAARNEAHVVYTMVRGSNRPGQDDTVDAALDKLRNSLGSLNNALKPVSNAWEYDAVTGGDLDLDRDIAEKKLRCSVSPTSPRIGLCLRRPKMMTKKRCGRQVSWQLGSIEAGKKDTKVAKP